MKITSKTETAVQAPTPVSRVTVPRMPVLAELTAQQTCQRIKNASGWAPHLAIMEIKPIRVLNLHPQVAAYKAEMLEYLGTLQE